METIQLLKIVRNYFGTKAIDVVFNSEKKEVYCLLYGAFYLKCGFDEPNNCFGAGIMIGNGEYCITDFLGKKCSLNSDEKSIHESLKIVDDYCKLRLPDKYLLAYETAYKG